MHARSVLCCLLPARHCRRTYMFSRLDVSSVQVMEIVVADSYRLPGYIIVMI